MMGSVPSSPPPSPRPPPAAQQSLVADPPLLALLLPPAGRAPVAAGTGPSPHSSSGNGSGDVPTPVGIVARFVRRHVYRLAAGEEAKVAVLLLGGYLRKFHALARTFAAFGEKAVMLSPDERIIGRVKDRASTADAFADIMDAHGFGISYVIPLVDNAIAAADALNTRLRAPANDLPTSVLRRDKFAQQDAVRAAGLPVARQRRAHCVEEAVHFWEEVADAGNEEASGSEPSQRVVVKPCDGSAGEGIWLCRHEAEVREAFAREFGRVNSEGSLNRHLVLMEFLEGEDWVVNSVSCSGVHVATDVWRGPAKAAFEAPDGGPARFVYLVQLLAGEDDRRAAVLAYVWACLDALGLQHGAAHTELVWTAAGPRLLEVNARPAGGLPRTPSSPDQLQALGLSIRNPDAFCKLPAAPPGPSGSSDGRGAAVVFLRAPFDGYILGAAVEQLMSLRTFSRFERNDALERGRTQPVRRTIGLFTSPGAVVLIGDPAVVLEDVEAVRAVEAVAYSEELPTEPGDDDEAAAGG